MPLLRNDAIDYDVHLGLWEMTEHPSAFPALYEEACHIFRAEARQREYVCVRALLREMTNDPTLTITHLSSGKPVLSNGWHISISHTKGYCCVILSPTQEVGVDIEYMSDRVSTIAHKFMRTDENAATVVSQLIHWSVKETLFKLFSDDALRFEEMRLLPFTEKTSGTLLAENLKRNAAIEVSYEIHDIFVLTHAKMSSK